MKRLLKPRVLGDISTKKADTRGWSAFGPLASRVNLADERVIRIPLTKTLRIGIIVAAAIFLVFGSAVAPTFLTRVSGDSTSATATSTDPAAERTQLESQLAQLEGQINQYQGQIASNKTREDAQWTDQYFERQNCFAQFTDPRHQPYDPAIEYADREYSIADHSDPGEHR
jgi:TolA-binding protein